MDYIYSLILGIIQGLTEFLPVSSSAHLVIAPFVMGVKSEFLKSLSFDAALHAGTLCGVVIFFWNRIISLFKSFFKGLVESKARHAPDFKASLYIIIATIPAVIGGLALSDLIETAFRNPVYIAAALIVFGVILYIADVSGKRNKPAGKMTYIDAIAIGLAQVFSLVPGVSRSGVTITAALFLGYKREEAAEFSFLISIPAIAGAAAIAFKHLIKAGLDANAGVLAIGFIASLLSGLFAVKFLLSFVKKHTYTGFVIYRILLGSAILFFVLSGLIK